VTELPEQGAGTVDILLSAQAVNLRDKFSHAWQEARGSGPEPDIDAYLVDFVEPERSKLAGVLEDIAHRFRHPQFPENTEVLQSGGPEPTPNHCGKPVDRATTTLACADGVHSSGETENTDFVLTGVALETLKSDLATVAGYDVLEILGRGAMGVVYKARQRSLKRVVALKMILAGGHASEAELARFRNEAEAVAHLQHPHIVQVYEVGEIDGCPYLALEYVDGGSLQKRTSGLPQPALPAAQLVQVLAQTMDFAHRRGIAHRDLKPANVLLSAPMLAGQSGSTNSASPWSDQLYGMPKIADFGLAKRLENDAGQTRTGTILGTPSYMAPEQAEGKSRDVGTAADQYALGAILYELLTGRPPFQGATVWETLNQVRSEEPVPPSRLQPRVPRDLETICLKALEKEPSKRYADTGALADDLRRFVAGEPIHARSISRHERFWRWCRRDPLVAGLMALVCILVLYGTGYTWLSYYQIRLEKAATEEQRQIALKNQRQAEEHAEQARQSQDRADKQRSLALKTLGTLIAQVQRELNGADDVLEVRRKLVEEALRGLNEVAKSTEPAGLLDKNMAEAYFQLGGVFAELDQTEEAYRQYRRGYDALAELAERDPTNDRAKGDLAAALTKIGDMRRRFQGEEAARSDYLKALNLRKELVEHPRDYGYAPEEAQRELANAYAQLATTSPDPADAWQNHHQALEIRRELLAGQPGDEGLEEELAKSYLGLGDKSYHLGKPQEAQAYYQGGLDLYEKLVAKHSRSPHLRQLLGLAWEGQGITSLFSGDALRARKQLTNAVQNYEQTVRLAPRNVSYREDLARGAYALASAALRLGDAKIADQHYAQALKIREARMHTNPNDVSLQKSYMVTLARCGHVDRAVQEAEKIRKSLSKDNGALYGIACCYALCVSATGRGKDAQALSADERGRRQRYAQQAIAALQQAVEHGFKDLIGLETDPDLDSIRVEAGYKSVVERLKNAVAALKN